MGQIAANRDRCLEKETEASAEEADGGFPQIKIWKEQGGGGSYSRNKDPFTNTKKSANI